MNTVQMAQRAVIEFLDERRSETTEDISVVSRNIRVVKMFPRDGQFTAILEDKRDNFYYIVDWLGTTGVYTVEAFEKVDEGRVG